MKNLKITYMNQPGQRRTVTRPMEEWIADWWYECDFVPCNDDIVYEAELNGENILKENCPVLFEDIAQFLLWEKLYESYQNDVIGPQHFKEANTSQDFKKWLNQTISLRQFQVDRIDLVKAEQVLVDNGIDPEEAYIVLQAIGYTLLNTELYPDNN